MTNQIQIFVPTIIYSGYSVTHVSDCVYVIKSKDLLRFVSATARFHFEALFNAGFKESDIIKQVLGLQLLLVPNVYHEVGVVTSTVVA